MRKLKHLLPFLASGIVAVTIGWHQVTTFQSDLTQERAYITREIQEGLSSLHRDLVTVAHLAEGSPDHAPRETNDYLNARREAFVPVRWLGLVSSPQARPTVILASATTRGFDQRDDDNILAIVKNVATGGMAATVPRTYRDAATLALAFGPTDAGGGTLLALVDPDGLLDDSLRAHGHRTHPMRLLYAGQTIGQWPHGQNDGPTATFSELELGPLNFTVAYTSPSWADWLGAALPLPLAIVLAAAAMTLAFHRRPPPAPAVVATRPDPVSNAPFPSQIHRDRLWHLGEMAATLAHDLGQPLNVIRLNAEAVGDAMAGGRLDEARLQRALDAMAEQTTRARAMFETVIAASRRPIETAGPLCPRDCVRAALAEQIPVFRRTGIHLKWHTDTAVPTVLGHGPRFAAALRHLLTNAVEALISQCLDGHSGTVAVECRRQGDGVEISIADDGPGFPPAVLESLSTPTPPASGRGKGCGLGLTIVAGVVAEMGGALSIDPAAPGTRISLRLPAYRQSLLLVDDDTDALTGLAENMTFRGWDVRVANGGNTALSMFIAAPTDAVVTDLHMPGGDGWTLIRQLRTLTADMPIVVMTAAADDETRQAVTAGASLTLQKPVTAAALARELTELRQGIW